jgi:hypothetical protein
VENLRAFEMLAIGVTLIDLEAAVLLTARDLQGALRAKREAI